jgi:hypothetical protein
LSQPSTENLASFTIQQLNLKSSSRLGTITEGEEDFCKSKSSIGERPAIQVLDNSQKTRQTPSGGSNLVLQEFTFNPKKHFSERVPSPKPIVHEELSPSFLDEKAVFQTLWRHQGLTGNRDIDKGTSKLTKKDQVPYNNQRSAQSAIPSKGSTAESQKQFQLPSGSVSNRKSKVTKSTEQLSKPQNDTLRQVQEKWEQEEQLKFQSALCKLGRLDNLVIQLQQQVSRSRATQIIF